MQEKFPRTTEKIHLMLPQFEWMGTNVTQNYLGHKNIETTQIYARMEEQEKLAAMGRITLKETDV